MLRLAGVHEVSEALGVSRQRVHQLAKQSGFPPPVAVLRAGAIWNMDDIDDWRHTMRAFNDTGTPAIPARDPERPQDDPWDANAVRYLLGTPEGSRWSRGSMMEHLRAQRRLVARRPEKVQEAAGIAAKYGVERRPDPGGKTLHFFRTDDAAPRPYPRSAAERRKWLASGEPA